MATKRIEDLVSGHIEDGYMGAMKWVGSNSDHSLYGAELSKAIREELKAYGLGKGVSVRAKTYSGGQSIDLTIKATEADFVPVEKYIASYKATDLGRGWIYDSKLGNWNRRAEDFWSASEEEQDRLLKENAVQDYIYYFGKENNINENRFNSDSYKMFTREFMKRLQNIKAVVDSFNYDDSNSMVDYFCRDFYETYYINAKALAPAREALISKVDWEVAA